MNFHQHPIETPFGMATITPQGAGYFYLDANSNGRPGLTVNGVEYGVSAHFKEVDGGIVLDDYLYAHRRIDKPGSWDARSATPSAKAKLIAGLLPVVVTWAAENYGLVSQADQDRLTSDIRILEDTVRAQGVALSERLAELVNLDRSAAQKVVEELVGGLAAAMKNAL